MNDFPAWKRMIKELEEWEKNLSPELRALRRDFSKLGEEEERKKKELLRRLTSRQRKLREKIMRVDTALAEYWSASVFDSEEQLERYIREGNEKLKPLMDWLVKQSEQRIREVLTESEWGFIRSAYLIYKEDRSVPLRSVVVLNEK